LGSVTPPPWPQFYFGLLSAFASNAGNPSAGFRSSP